jgi:Mg2+-importing ATPase
MLFVFNCWNDAPLFQVGWFVESLLTQTLIIHIIRTARIPFLESRASTALISTTVVIVAIAGAIPYTPWARRSALMLAYATLTHFVKMWFVRRWGM